MPEKAKKMINKSDSLDKKLKKKEEKVLQIRILSKNWNTFQLKK